MLSIKESCLLPAAVVAVADASEFAAQHEAAALSLQALTPHQQHLPLPLTLPLTLALTLAQALMNALPPTQALI